jgi:hypothetical protein
MSCRDRADSHLPSALAAPDEFPSNDAPAAAQRSKEALAHSRAPVNHDDLAARNKRGAHSTDLVAAAFLAIHVAQAEMQTGDLQTSLIHRLTDEGVQAFAGMWGYFHVLGFYLNVHS